MNQLGELEGEPLFCCVDALVAVRAELRDLFKRQKRQELEALLDVVVRRIAPVLIEFVGARLVLVQPDGALLRLAHLLALARREQGKRHRKGGLLLLAADEVGAR